MTIKVYTFLDANDNVGSWRTLDIIPAQIYAQEHKLKLIANTFVFDESELVQDYTGTVKDEKEEEIRE